MTQTLTTFRTASTAIAAVLALSSTPLLAQDAAPVIVLPDASPVIAPVPAAPAAPVATDPVTVATPVVQAVPTPAEPAATPRAAPVAAAPARATAAPVRRAAAAPVAVTTTTAAPAAVTEAAPAPVPQVAPVEDVAPQAVAPAEPVAVADDGADMAGPLLGGAAVLGLGILGFAAMRRRKTVVTDDRVAIVEKPRVAPAADPAMAAVADVPHRAGTPVQPIRTDHAFDRSPALTASGGAVALPRTSPQTNEERTALLHRMVAARPDRANPFTARKARMRRAKLILQSLDHDFADRDPLFDASDYPQNWPLVARRKYATAA